MLKKKNGEHNDIMFQSNRHNWGTPQKLYDSLNEEFDFTLDACADESNYKHKNYYTKEDDALSLPWCGRVYMNPPHGTEIKYWIKKAYEESQTNAEVVVCLIPARTDTRYWHEYVLKGEIRYLKGRVRFEVNREPANSNAPFPSAIVVFRKIEDE